MAEISESEITKLKDELNPLIGLKIGWLSIPKEALVGFEPSQIAVIINTLADGALPQVEQIPSDPEIKKALAEVGLKKPRTREFGQRESYPDYEHKSGKRVELKGLFVDNPNLTLKRPPTKREPSARINQHVTKALIDPARDVLLVTALQLKEENGLCSPFIIDIGLFSMAACVRTRDHRLLKIAKGKWVGGVPYVPSKSGMKKLKKKQPLTNSDYERDTNFGKLKRIPYRPLVEFLRKHGVEPNGDNDISEAD